MKLLNIITVLQTFLSLALPAEAVKQTSYSHSCRKNPLAFAAKPISRDNWPDRFPAKEHCSKCGLCETSFVEDVSISCAFLNEGMQRIDHMEKVVHGRGRKDSSNLSQYSEDRFGVLFQPILLAKGMPDETEDVCGKTQDVPKAQWTGLVTSIASSMLEENLVDAVVCIASSQSPPGETSFAEPLPMIARTTKDLLKGRGVKPSLAPSLSVLDEIKNDHSIKRLLFCGVGCAVQAFRAVEEKLGLDKVYVLGVNCADNSPTPLSSQNFLKQSFDLDSLENVQGYEFMQDFRVHIKISSETGESIYKKKPYFCLPSSVAKDSIAPSCLACFDYTNSLSDVVVGYMGAPLESSGEMHSSFQTLTCRNKMGKEMIDIALEANRIVVFDEKKTIENSSRGLLSFENLAVATVSADTIVRELIEKDAYTKQNKTMPFFLGDKIASVLGAIGPRGLDFATYSIDYHILRNYLYVLDTWGTERVEQSLPQYAKDIVQHYVKNHNKFRELHETLIQSKAVVDSR